MANTICRMVKVAENRVRSRARTERALISAARSMIATRPYAAIRVSEVADLAGCNHGLITHYFGGKLGLFTAVLHSLAGEVTDALSEHPTANVILEHEATATFWRLLAALLNDGLDPQRALVEGQPAIALIEKRASEMSGRSLAELRPLAALVLLLVGGYHVLGDVFSSILRPSDDDPDGVAHFQRLMNLILTGLDAKE